VAAFVDTNVIVYAFDRSEERKRRIALELLADQGELLVVSAQVLAEFFWTVTRKLRPPLPEATAQQVVKDLSVGPVVPMDAGLIEASFSTARRHQLALWDAMIVESAIAGGCERLLTEDLSPGQVIRGLRIEDPFA
jgi:predicted nucleic acid-binding protein